MSTAASHIHTVLAALVFWYKCTAPHEGMHPNESLQYVRAIAARNNCMACASEPLWPVLPKCVTTHMHRIASRPWPRTTVACKLGSFTAHMRNLLGPFGWPAEGTAVAIVAFPLCAHCSVLVPAPIRLGRFVLHRGEHHSAVAGVLPHHDGHPALGRLLRLRSLPFQLPRLRRLEGGGRAAVGSRRGGCTGAVAPSR